ncbi:cofilin [Gurleya vavrai]
MPKLENFESIKKIVDRIRKREYILTLFTINKEKTAYEEGTTLARNYQNVVIEETEKIKISTAVEPSNSARIVPSQKIIETHFNEFCKLVRKDEVCYIVIDFKYFNKEGAYRNSICLISYIPDDYATADQKFAYSRHSLELKDYLNANLQFGIHCKEDLNYENIVDICSSVFKF